MWSARTTEKEGGGAVWHYAPWLCCNSAHFGTVLVRGGTQTLLLE